MAGVGPLAGQEIRPADPILMEPISPEQARKVAGPVTPRSLRDELLERFDRNHDGRLDEAELAEAQKFAAERFRLGPGADSDRLALIRVIRTAVEADPVLRRRFDTNQDGTLSDGEWLAARRIIAQNLQEPPWMGPPPAPQGKAASPEEQRRREAVAAEMARRRKESEAAISGGAKKP